MASRRPLLLALAVLAAGAVPAAGQAPPAADRPMGAVSSWGHELNQDELPRYRPDRLPYAPARWYRIVDRTLRESGGSGLWFTGPSALPFPPLPLAPNEPTGWRTHARFSQVHRATGLRWDVSYEVWAARRALQRGALVVDPTVGPTQYTQRVSLLDPLYRRTALAEIRRIVPRLRGRPYVFAYQGSDEPLIRLPRGARAERSAYARTMRRAVRAQGGWDPPRATARPTRDPRQGLRWLAYNRWAGARFFAMKAEQARLIRRLDPGALVVPNDYGFIRGFVPWDYTRLEGVADIAEADPYVSLAENLRPGRGRYNPGFAAKLMSDLTGARTRIILQAFTYSGYTPEVADLYAWGGQALRAGATDLALYALDNPRFTAPAFHAGMRRLAADLRGTRLPPPPVDPATVVVYATASEGQGQPAAPARGDDRYLASGDALYTTYALLGEESRGAFRFDSDTRLVRAPARLAAARTVWLPRGDTLDRPFAVALRDWVRAGGTLVVTDPDAAARTPSGAALGDVRPELVGPPLGGERASRVVRVEAGALAPGVPEDDLYLPVDAPRARAFASVPAGARVVGRYLDDAPALLVRDVGRGRVVTFSWDPMRPQSLLEPVDLARFVRALHGWTGGTLDHPAWSYRVPGSPEPDRPPWTEPGDEAAATGR